MGILQAIQNGEKLPPAIQRWSKYLLVDGVLCRQSRNSSKRGIQIVVPEKLRPLVFDQLHCIAGHLGVHKTFEKVMDRYFWPGYEKDILHLVEKCEPCQRRNQPAPTPQAPLGTITSTYPFQKFS